jgi:hypothetical protein
METSIECILQCKARGNSTTEAMEELYLGEGMGGSGREKGSVRVQVGVCRFFLLVFFFM